MTTQEIIDYYANLLILQYRQKEKAYATIQTLVAPVIMDQLPQQVQDGFNLLGDSPALGVQLDVVGKYAGVTRYGYDLAGNPITLNDDEFLSLIQIAIVSNNSGSSLSDIQNLVFQFFPNKIFVYDSANMQMSYLVTAAVGNQLLIEVFITKKLFPKPMGVTLSAIIYVPEISLFGFQTYDNNDTPWSSSTIYSIGDQVFENGIIYSSLVNDNLNNAVTDTDFWVPLIFPFNTYDTYPVYEPYTWLSYSDTVTLM